MNQEIEIFDSTLRDGAQGESIFFSVEDKLAITKALDTLGVRYIEAGNPGSNPKDMEFFQRVNELKLKHATLVAFGSTCRKHTRPEEDANCQAIVSAETDAVAIFGKCWDLHVDEILRTSSEENLRMIEDTCRYFKKLGKEVLFDAEHFFDGCKANRKFAFDALASAVKGGADCLVLCDTNGGMFPDEIYEMTNAVCTRFPSVRLGIHCHNDGGMAVANSIAGIKAGACHVQGTYLGYGERCGNASLCTIIANLQLKLGLRCIPEENLTSLTQTALEIAEISNVGLNRGEPFVGNSAFAHKAGMHADGVLKLSRSFEHINPEAVGNHRRFLTSEMSGRTAIIKKIQKVCPDVEREDDVTGDIINELKEREFQGYQYEGAEGSFELLILKRLGRYKPFFKLVSYKILGEQPYDHGYSATATLKLKVHDHFRVTAAEGDGPVNALDLALREVLVEFYPELKKVHLIDFKVRVMDSKDGTAAKIRVLITTTDGKEIWTTIGVSTDVIEASWYALVDSVELFLSRTRKHF